MLDLRVRPRAWVYTVEWRIEGPESRSRDARGIPAPVIQMGRFNVPRDDEEDLESWYAQERMPMVSRTPGCVGGRKLLAAAGDPKHAVLYEFISLEAGKPILSPSRRQHGRTESTIMSYTRRDPHSWAGVSGLLWNRPDSCRDFAGRMGVAVGTLVIKRLVPTPRHQTKKGSRRLPFLFSYLSSGSLF